MNDPPRNGKPAVEARETPRLKRALGLPLLTLYGLGTMLGAGIYALVGEVAGIAGWQGPWAFLVAALLALLSGLSFAELASRYPKSAGEAVYVRKGFESDRLATAVGLVVAVSGIVSAGALANAFIGYLFEFVSLPRELALVATVAGIALIAAWGIAESVALAALITTVEVIGLLIILWVGGQAADPAALTEMAPLADPAGAVGLMGAALLAFYAFIGFEDMVNVAEEVKRPKKILPLALILALLLTTVLYVAVATVSLLVLPPEALAASDAPLAAVYMQAAGHPATLIGLISLVAIVNGAIVQVIMAARVAYGMARRGWLPRPLAYVHPWTRTPLVSTALVAAIVLALALAFDLAGLARVTSLLLLGVFALVNAALLAVKRREDGRERSDLFTVPAAIPLLGMIASAGMVALQLARWAGWS